MEYGLYLTYCILFMLMSNYSCQSGNRIQKIKLLQGSSTVLVCTATEYPNSKIFFQWIRNGFGYQADTMNTLKGGLKTVLQPNKFTYSLEIKNAQNIDSGDYTCQIDQNIGDNHENQMIKYRVEIIVPPTKLNFSLIQYNTDNIYVNRKYSTNEIWAIQDRRIKLKCVFIGSDVYPIPDLEWSDKNLFRKNYNEKNDTVDILVKPNLNLFNITCKIRNKGSYLGAKLPILSVTLRVLYIDKPVIKKTNPVKWKQINEGDLVSAECVTRVTPSANSISYKWQLILQNGKVLVVQNNTSSRRLLLKIIRQHHQARLQCVVTASVTKGLPCNNEDGKNCILTTTKIRDKTDFLNVLYAPVLAQSFESVTIDKLGTQIELSCQATSNPPSTVRWYKSDVGTNSEARSIKWYHDTLLSSLLETLRFINVLYTGPNYKILIDSKQKLDIYICEVEYYNRQKIYKYVMVAEREKPSVRTGRRQLIVKSGKAASLMCLFESWPKLPKYDIVWTKKSHENTKEVVLKNDKGRFHIKNRSQLMGIQSKLFFSSIQDQDYGIYNCSIKYASKTVSAAIKLKPPYRKAFSMFIPVGLIGALFLIIIVIVLVCCCKKWRKSTNNKGMYNNTLTHPLAPLQLQQNPPHMLYPSPTIDSCMEQDMFLSRINSVQGFPGQKEGSINMPQNRCFVFNTKQGMIRKFSCGDGVDDKVKMGNERSWDSGLCPDDGMMNGLLYRNNANNGTGSVHSGSTKNNNSTNSTNLNSGSIPPANQNSFRSHQPPYYILGNNTTSPFSTLASSSNNSINGGGRYWPPVIFNPNSQGNPTGNILDNGSDTTLNNANNNPTIIGYHDSGNGIVPIATNNPLLISNQVGDENGSINGSTSQSYVCIPIEEYQNHLRMMRKGGSSLGDSNSVTKLSQNDIMVNNNANHGDLPNVMMSTFTNNNMNNETNSSSPNNTPNNITPTKIASPNK